MVGKKITNNTVNMDHSPSSLLLHQVFYTHLFMSCQTDTEEPQALATKVKNTQEKVRI